MMELNEKLANWDLAGINLSSQSLGGRDLRGKNLRGADLSYAHLGNADLSGADLRNANLYRANLGAANLTGADMRYCDLREANLKGSNLNGTDLREVIGLEKADPVPDYHFIKPITLEETRDFVSAKENGYFPLAHWGKSYALADGKTLYRAKDVWKALKTRLGDAIFGDRQTFSEVRLVKQYEHYSQWAYMISKKGFERIVSALGLKIKPKG